MTCSYLSIGAEQTFTVPDGVQTLEITAVGGLGGNSIASGGSPAAASIRLGVIPGRVLNVEVGGHGGDPDSVSRLVVAAGGGGGTTEAGGDAGQPGTGRLTFSTGGQPGTLTSGGAAGVNLSSFPPGHGFNGTAGRGGPGYNYLPGAPYYNGWARGGGAGRLYGGGGGGLGAGGGGGGSYAPGGTKSIATGAADSSVVITYQLPA